MSGCTPAVPVAVLMMRLNGVGKEEPLGGEVTTAQSCTEPASSFTEYTVISKPTTTSEIHTNMAF